MARSGPTKVEEKNGLAALRLVRHFIQPIECAPLISFFNQLPLKFNCLHFVLFHSFHSIAFLFCLRSLPLGGAIGAAAPITHPSSRRQRKATPWKRAALPPAFTSFNQFTNQIKNLIELMNEARRAGPMLVNSFFISSARPLGRASWKEIKRIEWAGPFAN